MATQPGVIGSSWAVQPTHQPGVQIPGPGDTTGYARDGWMVQPTQATTLRLPLGEKVHTMATATTKPVQTDAELLAAREKELMKKYKRIVPGSIQRETDGAHSGKITVEIKCKTPDCPNVRRVATSDLFQVQYCEECTIERRNKKRRLKSKALRAEATAPKAAKSKGKKARKARKVAASSNGKHDGEQMPQIPTTRVHGTEPVTVS